MHVKTETRSSKKFSIICLYLTRHTTAPKRSPSDKEMNSTSLSIKDPKTYQLLRSDLVTIKSS